MNTRKIEIKDAAYVASLTHQLGYEATITETRERLAQILSDSNHCVLVCLEADMPVGWIHAFIGLHLESGSFAEIGGLVVDEKFRGRGVGKKLIQQVEKWAVNHNCYKLRVRSNVTRKETHQFYLHHGFTFTKEQKIFDKQIN